jgi:Deoxyribonuclease II
MPRSLTLRVPQVVLFLMFAFGPAERALCQTSSTPPPSPLVKKGQPVDWWFVFKFNAQTFPRPATSTPTCLFGGTPGGADKYKTIGQDYVYGTADDPALVKGAGYIGDSTNDPVGATFDEVYNGNLSYVVWNDQFYRQPLLACEGTDPTTNDCSAPWAHSKGLIAWDTDGNGFVMQVTTPSWPAAGSNQHSRTKDGNSLGCVNDDDVELSQDFFALKLNKADLLVVLQALYEEGAVTDKGNLQIVRTGGPQEVLDAVSKLGNPNATATYTSAKLSSGVTLIAKAGGLGVPPWQLVSGLLGGAPLLVANFWQDQVIHSTTADTPVSCWPPPAEGLSKPGPVVIAETGNWGGTKIGLTGMPPKPGANGKSLGANHAKIAVSGAGGSSLTIFGDMNQDGILSGNPPPSKACFVSQNARGGLFFVVDNVALHDSVVKLLTGDTDPPQ